MIDTIQRGPIWKTDADGEKPYFQDGFDGAEGYESSLRRWRESAREEAQSTAKLSQEIDSVSKYVQALQGDYWDRKRAKYKSRYFDNRIGNSRITDLALLTDTRPTIDVSTKIEAYKQQAEMTMKIIQSEWLRNDMDLDLVRVVDIAKLHGTGFWKVGAALPGTMQVIPCGPESVMPIQPGFHLQQSTAVLYRTWKPLHYFRNKFPFRSAGLETESNFPDQTTGSASFSRPAEIPEYTWNGLAPGLRRALGIKVEASATMSPSLFPTLELQEYYVDDPAENESVYPVLMRNPYLSLESHNYWYWVQPGERLYPRKRLIIFGGRKRMYDGPAPFWHGLYPFACLRLNPVPWSFWGLSKYRDLLPLNQAMNEIGAGVMDMIKRALNPVTVTKSNAVPLAAWNAFYPDLPGARLMMMPNASIADLRYMDPPNIPSWVLAFHQYLGSEFDRLAGAVDTNALAKKKQVPGGDTIEQMRDAQNSATRLEGRYIEAFLRDAGIQASSNVFQYFPLPQRLRLLGADGISLEDFNATGPNLIPDGVPKEDHWRKFSLIVSPGSLHGGSKDREKQLAMSLAAKHLIPMLEFYKRMEFANPQALIDQLLKEQEAGIGGATGRAPRTNRAQRNGGV